MSRIVSVMRRQVLADRISDRRVRMAADTFWPAAAGEDTLGDLSREIFLRLEVAVEPAALVESAGHASLSFTSADAFLRSQALPAAACVIADVRMPGIDGLELQRRIRLARPTLPVIFISAHGDDAVRNRALEGGAIAFLDKPFDAAALLAAISQALSERPEPTEDEGNS